MKLNLTTERLLLKPVSSSDFEVFREILTDEFVRKYLCDDEILSSGQIEDFISDSENAFAEKNYGLWLIIIRETGETIGFTGLRGFFGESQPQLLYALLPQFTGKGFALEAAQQIIKYAFSQLNYDYLDAACDAPNIASQKLAQRLGMKKLREEIKDELPGVIYRLEKTKK